MKLFVAFLVLGLVSYSFANSPLDISSIFGGLPPRGPSSEGLSSSKGISSSESNESEVPSQLQSKIKELCTKLEMFRNLISSLTSGFLGGASTFNFLPVGANEHESVISTFCDAFAGGDSSGINDFCSSDVFNNPIPLHTNFGLTECVNQICGDSPI